MLAYRYTSCKYTEKTKRNYNMLYLFVQVENVLQVLPQGVHQALKIHLPILFTNFKRSFTNFMVQIVKGLVV